MTAVWRATVPSCPILGSFRERPQSAIARFAPEIGEPLLRARSTRVVTPATMTFMFMPAEKTEFEAMYADDFAYGSVEFTMPYPAGGASKTWQFEDEPDLALAGSYWLAALSLLRLD